MNNLADKYREIINDIISNSIKAVENISSIIDDRFFDVIELMINNKSRLIISGIGKSGYVARKFAATLSSTGTKAYFLHPSEASHGDLGMIDHDDIVILISNSGETRELGDIIDYCNNHKIKTIAITSGNNSMLAKSANIALIIPKIKEASDLEAPTISVIVNLVITDIIAIIIYKERCFTINAYRKLHPGGKIGLNFTKIDKIMHVGDELPVVKKDTIMSEVIFVITAKKFGCAGIIDKDNKLVGIITDGDLRRHMSDDLLKKYASDVMTKNPLTIGSDNYIIDALTIMNEKGKTCLFVVDKNEAIGIVHIHDCVRSGINDV